MFRHAFFIQWLVMFTPLTNVEVGGACHVKIMLDIQYEADNVNCVSVFPVLNHEANMQLTDVDKLGVRTNYFALDEDEVHNFIIQSL